MEHKKPSGFQRRPRDPFGNGPAGLIGRRSFLDGARRFAVGGMTAGAVFGTARPNDLWAQGKPEPHPASASLVDQLRTRFTFQISVDVGNLQQSIEVATAALAGGVDILEMGTPLLKTAGVANVVPAFRKQFPKAILLADMKTMDGGGGEARTVYAAGGNIVDFLALAGVETAKSVCAVRDEFRSKDPGLPRLAFADILLPHQGPGAQAAEVALRMLDAGVDSVGIHLQVDARRADPKLIENDYLGEVARAVFDRVGKTAPVQVVGGLHGAQAKRLARAGLRAFVISGNLGQADGVSRYNLPAAQIEKLIAGFIAEVSGA